VASPRNIPDWRYAGKPKHADGIERPSAYVHARDALSLWTSPKDYAHEIASVYNALPTAARPTTIVVASNCGEPGAADRYGPAGSLPAVYSGRNASWYWGPPPASATTAIRGRL
jgi:hypothetical protein